MACAERYDHLDGIQRVFNQRESTPALNPKLISRIGPPYLCAQCGVVNLLRSHRPKCPLE
jgi:hypothetical protein